MIKIVNIRTATNKKTLRADSTDIGFKNSHRRCRWWYWYMKWSVTRVWRLKAAHDQINSGNWVGKKSTSDNHTSHLQQNTHGSINNNYISSMSQMIYILNLSGALNQAKRPNHSQLDWICVRVFFLRDGTYIQDLETSEKTMHGQGDCWCMLFCS